MSKQRALHRLVRLFPDSYRATRGDEIHDALAVAEQGRWQQLREAISLVRAALTAWRRFLRTPAGIRNAAFFGAMAWFGFLIALGPVGRVQRFDAAQLHGFYLPGNRTQSMMAAGLLAVAFVLALRNRLLAAAAGLSGVAVAALSIRVGDWQMASALRYEMRWLAIPLLAALALRGSRRVGWIVATSALPGVVLAVGPWAQASRGTGYGFTLSRINDRPFVELGEPSQVLGGSLLAVVLATVAAAAIIGPWLAPACAAIALPSVVHISMSHPFPTPVLLAAYLAAVIWIRVYWQPDLRRMLYGRPS